MAVNWNLLQNVDVAGSFQKGVEQAKQRQGENALAAFVQNPQDTNAFAQLAKSDPKLAYQVRNNQQEQDWKRAKYQQDARESQSKQVEAASKFLDQIAPDGSNYGQIIQAARLAGVDVSEAPQAFDPQWVGTYKTIAQAFAKDPDGLTSEAKNLVQLGYQAGTPEFQDALARTLNAKYAQPYIGSGGETRVNSPELVRPAMAGQPPTGSLSAQQAAPILRQAKQAGRITREELARIQGSFGSEGQLSVQDWIKRNGIRVIVRTGTASDGRRVAEYEDGTVDYAD